MGRKELESQIQQIGQADIVVGIPSYNNARTIGHVVQEVRTGLVKYFPEARAVLVNSDGGSQDGTPQVVAEACGDVKSILIAHQVNSLHKITTPYHGIPGKESAFHTIFEVARSLGVKACIIVDADLRSITPEWVELLLSPILKEGYAYVVPYYLRHKYDGTITTHIIYPLIRAVYGKRVCQPIGGEFGFSGELAAYFLAQEVWETDVARYGIDLWMITTAIARGCRICQVYLGTKIRDQKGPAADLSAMLAQVVGSLFAVMEEHAGLWKEIRGSEPIPLFGPQDEVGVEPIRANVDRMLHVFRLGMAEFLPLWEGVLSREILEALGALAGSSGSRFHLADSLWVRLIYDFALAAHRKAMTVEHLLKSLTPLYLGKVASFILEVQESSREEVEKRIETLCLLFEEEKPYLIEQWD